MPGCVSQGETIDELRSNIREAIEGWLLAADDVENLEAGDQIIELRCEAGFWARIVEKRGWNLARVDGSHFIFTMAGRRERIVVPIHGNRPLKTGLLRSLMKIAELTDGDL